MIPGSVMDRTKHDKRERIRWLYRLLDRAAARVDSRRLAEHLETANRGGSNGTEDED